MNVCLELGKAASNNLRRLVAMLPARVGIVILACTLPIILLISFNDDSPVSLALIAATSIVAAVVGVEIVVIRPLRNVRQAIDAWRIGQPFDSRVDRSLPSELRAFSLSFKRATRRLVRREAELRDAIARQELAMQEVHHRVKNNLQIVASLLNLQASRIRSPAIQAEFKSARNRVTALTTVHRHLYAYGEVQTINMRAFLLELCEQLFQAMGEVPGGRLLLEVDAPELDMSSDQVVPLALIVTEAVANAIKYAYPAGRGGTICVSLSQADGITELDISDDGVGIAAGQESVADEVRNGIGIQLINGFARQLGAELVVRHDDGTHYQVRMTLRRERLDTPAFGRGKLVRR